MNLLRFALILFLVLGFCLCLAIGGAFAATTYVPSASTEILSACLTRSSITAGFTDVLASTENQGERELLADVLRTQLKRNQDLANLDGDEDNDVTIEQLKAAYAALNWAFENPRWTPAQAFDITYRLCLDYNKERASGLGGGTVGQINS